MSTISITVDFSQVNALARRMGIDAKPAILHEMTTAMHRVVIKGERQAKSTAKHDTGDNRRRHTSTVEPVSGGVLGTIGTNSPHGPTVEFGRRPGAKMPPKGVLLGWMRRHNVPADREFVLRRAIARRGILGDHNIQHTVEGLVPDLRHQFGGVGPRVLQRLVKGVA